MEIPEEAFTAIYQELTSRPLSINRYRTVAGDGRSQTFGIVNKRCLPPNHSRQNWTRPYLYKLLCDFGEEYVAIPWNAITVNQNYKAAPHRDKGNVGQSFLVAFGDYEGGELEFHEGDKQGLHDIRHKPILHDFSKDMHSVKDFTGTRFSLVYYQLDTRGNTILPGSVRNVMGKWVFFLQEEAIYPSGGMPHPLRGRRKTT